ncbi:MAG: two-component regulator propeller domain-containing protein, partial [Anaerolineae bacterium]
MKTRCFSLLSLVTSLTLLLPGGVWPTAAQSRPVAPMNQTNQAPPGDAAMLAPQSGGTWRNYTNGNYVNALAVEGDYVWAGTSGGVVRWDRTDGSYVKYTTADGLADNDVRAVAIDGAGHLWFGTGGGGVSKFDGNTWTTYTTADGLAHNWVYDIAIDGAG